MDIWYSRFWEWAYSAIYQGFWARGLGTLALIMSLWFFFKRKSIRGGIMFFIVAFIMAYGVGFYFMFTKR